MAIVVTSKCQGCRYTECVAVCPAACFHLDERMVYIDPRTCIECRACIPVCPVQAIYDESELPAEFAAWAALNAERSAALPVIENKLRPLGAPISVIVQ